MRLCALSVGCRKYLPLRTGVLRVQRAGDPNTGLEVKPLSCGSAQAQHNHCDCGLFVLTYMDFFTYSPPLEGLALKSSKGASCQLDVATLERARPQTGSANT